MAATSVTAVALPRTRGTALAPTIAGREGPEGGHPNTGCQVRPPKAGGDHAGTTKTGSGRAGLPSGPGRWRRSSGESGAGGSASVRRPPGAGSRPTVGTGDGSRWTRYRVRSPWEGEGPGRPNIGRAGSRGASEDPAQSQRGGSQQDGSRVSKCRRKEWSGPRMAMEPVGWGLHGRGPTGGFLQVYPLRRVPGRAGQRQPSMLRGAEGPLPGLLGASSGCPPQAWRPFQPDRPAAPAPVPHLGRKAERCRGMLWAHLR